MQKRIFFLRETRNVWLGPTISILAWIHNKCQTSRKYSVWRVYITIDAIKKS